MKRYPKKFMLRIDDKTLHKLKELAEAEKCSMARIIRILIDNAHKKNKNLDSTSL